MSLLFTILRAPFRFVYWHPWWSIFLATVGFFVSTVGAYKFVEYRSYCDLAAAIAETDAASPRWRIEELEADRAVIPDAENSAIVIARVAALRKQAELNTPPEVDLDNIRGRSDSSRQHRLSEAKLNGLRDALRVIQPALDEATKLSKLPRGRWPIKHEPDGISTMLPHLGTARGVAQLLSNQALLASHDANSALATDCLIGMIHTAGSLADEPVLVSQGACFSMQSMSCAAVESSLALLTLDDTDLCRLDRVVVEVLNSLDGTRTLRAERAFLHTFFTHLEQADSTGYFTMMSMLRGWRTASTALIDPLYRPMIPADHAFALRMMNRGCVVATQPTETQGQAFDAWGRECSKLVLRGPLVYRNMVAGDMLPPVARYAEDTTQALAKLRLLRTAIAAERFRMAHQRWPQIVAELVPAFLHETPCDPFDGQPLRIIPREDGVSIYSVGQDRRDDEGEDIDSSVEGDISLTLFHPDQRGLPPTRK